MHSQYKNFIIYFITLILIIFPGTICHAHGGLGKALIKASLAVHFTASLIPSLFLVFFFKKIKHKILIVFLPSFLVIFIMPVIIIFLIGFLEIDKNDGGIIRDYIITMFIFFISLIIFYVKIIGKKKRFISGIKKSS